MLANCLAPHRNAQASKPPHRRIPIVYEYQHRVSEVLVIVIVFGPGHYYYTTLHAELERVLGPDRKRLRARTVSRMSVSRRRSSWLKCAQNRSQRCELLEITDRTWKRTNRSGNHNISRTDKFPANCCQIMSSQAAETSRIFHQIFLANIVQIPPVTIEIAGK